MPCRRLLAWVCTTSLPSFSIAMNPALPSSKKNGFEKWSHLPGIAEFPDRICGQYLYGKKILF